MVEAYRFDTRRRELEPKAGHLPPLRPGEQDLRLSTAYHDMTATKDDASMACRQATKSVSIVSCASMKSVRSSARSESGISSRHRVQIWCRKEGVSEHDHRPV